MDITARKVIVVNSKHRKTKSLLIFKAKKVNESELFHIEQNKHITNLPHYRVLT